MIALRGHLAKILFIALTAALVGSFAVAAQASHEQAGGWKIEGVVRDATKSAIVGASVRLENQDPALCRETATDSAGHFALSALSAGAYSLRIQKPGFSQHVQTIVIPLKEPAALAVVLLHAGEHAVSGESEVIQFSNNTDFTVAGVTDYTAAGGHGSDVNLRTSEALAKDARELAAKTPNEPAAAMNSSDLVRQRDQLRKMLASSDRPDLHRQLGDIEEQMNDSLAAVREYERATQLEPSEQNYFAWATELLLHRAIQPAVEVFTKGAAAYPRSERMLAGLGAALYASGLYAQAAERLCAASDLEPEDATAYAFLGKMTLASAQPLACAEGKLARFWHDQPGSAVANYYYALALWKKTANAALSDQVESLLKKCVSIDPQFAAAYLQLGIVYSARSENEKAIAALQKAKAADPNLAEVHFRLGQALKKKGDASQAREEFQAYERIQKTEASDLERKRREIEQFVVIYKDQPQALSQP